MTKTLTCWQLTNKIRKILGANHPSSPFILSHLEKKGWVEQKQPYKYTLCDGIAPTPAHIQLIVQELKEHKSKP